jgi:hypothetical protein
METGRKPQFRIDKVENVPGSPSFNRVRRGQSCR